MGYMNRTVVAEGGDLDVILELRQVGRMIGKVIDGVSKELIAEFRLRAVWQEPAEEVALHLYDESKSHSIRSESGAFQLQNLAPGSYTVVVSAPGYARFEQDGIVVPPGADSEPLLVELEPGGVLEGTVIIEEGHLPVAGAQIRVLERFGNATMGRPGFLETRSDASGFYRLEGLAVGSVTLQVEHPDFPQTVVDGPQVDEPGELQTFDIVLAKGGSIEGQVIDEEGRPDRAATIDAWLMNTWDHANRKTFVDEAGRFRLKDLAPGYWSIAILGGSLGGWIERTVEVKTGRTARVVFDARWSASVTGRVVRAGGPVSGVPVWLEDRDPTKHETGESDYGFAYSDGDGHFEIPGVSGGVYELRVENETGDAWVSRRVVVPAQGSVDVLVEFGSSSLSGTVRDPMTGLGAARARVYLYEGGAGVAPAFSLDVSRVAAVTADSTGAFVIDGLRAGRYAAYAIADGHGASDRTYLDVPDPGLRGVTLDLNPEGFLTVAVESDRGKSMAAAGVYLYEAETGAYLRAAITTTSGEVEIGSLAPGNYVVVGAHRDFAVSEPVSVKIRGSQRARAEIVLPSPLEAQVRVVWDDGTAAEGITIEIERDGFPIPNAVFKGDWVQDERAWVTDDAGLCRIHPIAEGRYSARIRTAGMDYEKTLSVGSKDGDSVTFVLPRGV